MTEGIVDMDAEIPVLVDLQETKNNLGTAVKKSAHNAHTYNYKVVNFRKPQHCKTPAEKEA